MEKNQKAIFYFSKMYAIGATRNDAIIPRTMMSATTFTVVFFFIKKWIKK